MQGASAELVKNHPVQMFPNTDIMMPERQGKALGAALQDLARCYPSMSNSERVVVGVPGALLILQALTRSCVPLSPDLFSISYRFSSSIVILEYILIMFHSLPVCP